MSIRLSQTYIQLMEYRRIRVAIVVLFVSTLCFGAFGQGIGKVLGIEAGYGLVVSSKELGPRSPSGVAAGLRYGYLILDKPSTSALLSLALGYDLFPQGAGSAPLQSFVYGLEYEHTFFRQSPVALSIEYGLLFDWVYEGGKPGSAFGNHTRIGLGPDFRLGEKDDLVALLDYNGLEMPYFEFSSARLSYISIALRYQRRL